MVLIEELPEAAPAVPPHEEAATLRHADSPKSTEDWVEVDHQDAASPRAPESAAAPQEEAAAPEEVEGPEVVQTKLARADAIKAEGNDLYASGQLEEAVAKYTEALAEAPVAPAAASQRAMYLCNRAACYLRLERHADAARDCSAAVEENPSYVKAYLRRSIAYEALDELERALADAQKVLELDPGNATAAAAVARLQPAVTERQEKMKEEMIGKLKDLGNVVLGKFGLSVDNFQTEKDPATGSYSIKFQQ